MVSGKMNEAENTAEMHFFRQKIWSIQKKAVLLQPLSRKDGRVVYCVGLENRSTERYRGFESLSFRRVSKGVSAEGRPFYEYSE